MNSVSFSYILVVSSDVSMPAFSFLGDKHELFLPGENGHAPPSTPSRIVGNGRRQTVLLIGRWFILHIGWLFVLC